MADDHSFHIWIDLMPLALLVLLGIALFNRGAAARQSLGFSLIRVIFLGWLLIFCGFAIDVVDELALVTEKPSIHHLIVWSEAIALASGIALMALGLWKGSEQIRRTHRQFMNMHNELAEREAFQARSQKAIVKLTRLLQEIDINDAVQFRRLLKIIAKGLRITQISYWIYDADKSGLTCSASFSTQKGPSVEGYVLTRQDFPNYFKHLDHNFLIAADDAQSDPATIEFTEVYLKPLDVRSLMDVFLLAGPSETGVICCEMQGQLRHWTQEDRIFVRNASSLIAAAISSRSSFESSQALLESERRFQAIADYTYDWESWISPEGQVIWVNSAVERITGYRVDEIAQVPIRQLVTPESYRQMRQLWADSLHGESGNDMEFQIIRKDRRLVWVAMSWQSIYDHKGKSLGVRTSVRDISQRVEQREKLQTTLKALQKSQEFLQIHFSNNPMTVFYWSAEGKILDVNPQAEKVFGYCREELVNRPIITLVPEDQQQRTTDLIEQFRADPQPNHKIVQNRVKDGRLITCDWYETPVLNDEGQVESIVSFGLDITERVRFERAFEAIYQSTTAELGVSFLQTLSRVLCETLDIGICIIGEINSKDSKRVTIVSSFSQDHDISAESYQIEGSATALVLSKGLCVVGRGVGALLPDSQFIHRNAIESFAGAALADQDQTTIGVMLLLDTKPFADADFVEAIIRIFASRAGAELERLRERRQREKLERRAQHSQRMETLGVLTGGIAHDFNNVLQPITGFTDLLLAEFPEGSRQHDDLMIIKQGAERATDLIKQMMAFGRNVEADKNGVDPNALIHETLRLARGSIPRSVEITTALDEQLPLISANSTQLGQVLMNLITNAYHASGDQGAIEIASSIYQVDESSLGVNQELEPGIYVKISVADDGAGMPQEVLERIFDPFYTTKEPGAGTGLGLSTALGIIKSHGGTIDAYSSLGRGSCLSIFIPADSPDCDEATVAGSLSQSADTLKQHLMVVDDERTNLELVSRILDRAGCTYDLFASSEQALEAFEAAPQSYDLLLTDQSMPKLSGIDLARKVREIRPDVAIIVMSGYSSDNAKKEWAALNPRGYLAKPFDHVRLAKLLHDS